MVNSSVLEKIKNLLNVAKDARGNENESQNAMLLAQKLMAKHKLEMSDLEIEKEDKQDNIVHEPVTNAGFMVWWKNTLSIIIAENFRCIAYLQHLVNGNSMIRFIGTKDDTKIAKEIFKYAADSIEYYSNEFKKQTNGDAGVKNDYIKGYIHGLQDKFNEQKKNDSELALILVTPDTAKAEFEKMNTKPVQPSKAKSSGSRKAYSKGYEEGQKFDPNMKRLDFNIKWF